MAQKETVFRRYYKRNGINQLSILSVGYSTYFCFDKTQALTPTEFTGKRHMLSFEILEWRAKCFGMQMFNFEMGINTPSTTMAMFERGGEKSFQRVDATAKTMWFAYKPAIKFYIPCCTWLAIELYGGAYLDMCKAWNMVNGSYYTEKVHNTATGTTTTIVPEQNWFVGAYGGLGFMLTPTPYTPIEIKAEYRHPLQGNTALVPQGIYLSAQLHLAAPTKKR